MLTLSLTLGLLKECIKCENIRHARKGDPQAGITAPIAEAIICICAPPTGEENLGGVEGSTGQLRLVNRPQGRGDLYDVVPDGCLWK